jgi:cob(I)alamin adenosyltransferase
MSKKQVFFGIGESVEHLMVDPMALGTIDELRAELGLANETIVKMGDVIDNSCKICELLGNDLMGIIALFSAGNEDDMMKLIAEIAAEKFEIVNQSSVH